MTKDQAKKNLAIAKKAGKKTFIGIECIRFHGGERYVCGYHTCVECSNIRNRTKKNMPKVNEDIPDIQYVGGFLI